MAFPGSSTRIVVQLRRQFPHSYTHLLLLLSSLLDHVTITTRSNRCNTARHLLVVLL